MAVSQNLARMPQPVLDDCRLSVPTLNRVCSFKALPRDDYLDADWAPALLIRAATEGAARTLIKRAYEGDAEVNPTYRDEPQSVWEHPVRAVDAADVSAIAADLRTLVDAGFPSPEGVATALAATSGECPTHPMAYLREHAVALADFYAAAAARRYAVVLWWD